jgi:hypothetical protein
MSPAVQLRGDRCPHFGAAQAETALTASLSAPLLLIVRNCINESEPLNVD